MKNRIALVVGDYSYDGHEKSLSFFIDSNLALVDLKKAYKKGVKKLGINVRKDVATDCADNMITLDRWKYFANAGCTIIDETHFKNGVYEIWDTKIFVDLWLFTAHIGDPEFEYSLIEDEDASIGIGGYGLFTD